MVPFDLARHHPGVILDGCVTAEAAADLTGYNIQHIRRLALAGKLEAVHVGRSWLIKIKSIETYLQDVVEVGDARFGPHVPAKPQPHDNASVTAPPVENIEGKYGAKLDRMLGGLGRAALQRVTASRLKVILCVTIGGSLDSHWTLIGHRAPPTPRPVSIPGWAGSMRDGLIATQSVS